MRGRIEKPPEPPQRIERETTKFPGCAADIRLEQTVDEPDGEGDIREEICHTHPRDLGNDGFVSLRHRFEHPEVELVVEVEHRPVEGLQGVCNPRLRRSPPSSTYQPVRRRSP